MRVRAAAPFLLWLVSVPAAGQMSFEAPIDAEGIVRGADAIETNAWGTGDLTALVIPEAEFTPVSSTVQWQWNDGISIMPPGTMRANVSLPSGARIETVEMEACDMTTVGSVSMIVYACGAPPESYCDQQFALFTSHATAPGCNVYGRGFALPVPIVIDNSANRYMLEVATSFNTTVTRFRAARLLYRLQVSPAPAEASFADVPLGHPLHQYVEALAAASITAGCGGGDFCPNDPITRGQMAVFLAKALGLHWPEEGTGP